LPGVIDALMNARTLASRRRGAGDVAIGVAPSIWVIPPESEALAVRALASVAATVAMAVNPLSGRLQIVVEPRLSDPNRSYLLAPPAQMERLGAARFGWIRRVY
jgi:hypothetical protein